MPSELDKLIDDETERRLALATITCPYCERDFDVEDHGDYTTLYGDVGWQEAECPECGKEFQVLDHVTREYEVLKRGTDDV